MKKFKCEIETMDNGEIIGCGKEIEYVTFDGYYIAERLLEGVIFECRKNDKDEWEVNVSEDSEGYFNQFNTTMWLDEAKDYAETIDILQCPHCGEDVVVNE